MALGLLLSLAAPAVARELDGVTMPDKVDVAGKPLTLNGMGVRKATFMNVKVYVAGLYVEQPTKDPSQILRSSEPKKLIMTFVRDVDRDKIVDTMDESFRKNTKNMDALNARLSKMLSLLPKFKEHDTMTFTYAGPGQGTDLQINGVTRGNIPGDDFAQALFAIWLGKEPPDTGLKKGLLGGR